MAGGRIRYGVVLGVLMFGLLLVGATALLASGGPFEVTTHPDQPAKLGPALQEALVKAEEGQHLRVIVHMQAASHDPYTGLPTGKLARRIALVQRLQQAATQSQADIRRALQKQTLSGKVSYYRPLWIINGIQVAADQDAIDALAARPDVSQVTLDAEIQLLEPTATLSVAPTPDATLPWHLQRTRVQHAWAGLGIDGAGATIAVMDTGADWQHPALIDTYLGLADGSPPQHEVAWFDAVDGSAEPFDPHGHGTHVIGTASGGQGIGVAPGSQWMAVRVLRANGSGSVGDIHAGFQWLLAPDGDPSLAPDIVNGSWSARPDFDEFMPDVEALRAAGILPVFSAGNTGPAPGTVRAPANYAGAVAVGATDDIDQVAWFSSRGPSVWNTEVKPTISAPGVQILSSLPSGIFGYFSGTSMASPHIAGMAALLLSADPTLDAAGITTNLTSTAHSTGLALPNDDSGWGRADAYSALASIVPTGRLLGQVSGDGLPLPNAAITITTPSSVELPYRPNATGLFEAPLISGTYRIAAAAYGYETLSTPDLPVKTGQDTEHQLDLIRLPHGRAEGRLLDLISGLPVSGTIRVTGTPVTATVSDEGRYDIELPTGEYQLVAWVRGHMLGREDIAITAGDTVTYDIWLEPGPDVLLIDSGQWYGGSQQEKYAVALQDNDFSYQTLTIRDPDRDGPTVGLLSQYEVVIWSSPKDSPGVIGSGDALSGFLDGGGKVLVSGQNVADIDEGQPSPQRWWHQQLHGLYLGKSAAPFQLQGEPGTVFQGFTLELSEEDSDGNPIEPDASTPGYFSLTQVGLRYPDGRAASLLAGQCESFRIAYFGFGLEDVTELKTRAALMNSTFDYFAQPETEVGLRFGQERVESLVPPGSQRSYPIQLLNLSEVHTDTFHLSLNAPTWPAQVLSDTIELGPCHGASTSLEVDIPAGLALDSMERIDLVAQSSIMPSYRETMTFDLKTPGRILLVDDDRWYDQSATFKSAMSDAGIAFDFWENGGDGGDVSPPADLLNAYDFVFWYTGYDWFRPITSLESAALSDYLAQGGRLFLTSQDYMYHHLDDPLTRDYLGVIHYAESVTPTTVYGPAGQGPFSDIGGPYALNFGPYQNNGDGIVPAPDAQVSLWHDAGYPAGVASEGPDWRTLFWAIPLETMPVESHAKLMDHILGWLGDLGQSTFLVGERNSLPGAAQTYTLTLRYAPTGSGTLASVTNTLPISLAIDPASLNGGAQYDQVAHRIAWSGTLGPGEEHQITYRATPQGYLLPGELIENRVQIYYEDHDLSFERAARAWIAVPDLSPSQVNLSPRLVRPGQKVTVELVLLNAGLTSPISASLRFPAEARPLTGTLKVATGETQWSARRLHWSGTLDTGQAVTASVVITTPMSPDSDWLPFTAILEDHVTDPIIASSWLEIKPYTNYMPLMASNKP